MACFLVPAAEAIIVSAAVKISEKMKKPNTACRKVLLSTQKLKRILISFLFPKSFLGSEICFGAARFCLRSSICGTVKFRRFSHF